MKDRLFGKTLSELGTVAESLGMPRHAARQMATWLYAKNVGQIDAMTDISAANRALLAQNFEIGRSGPVQEATSMDGTKKYLSPINVESVFIPDKERATLCLSSQAGCRMGCAFCATGRMGLAKNLSAGEILNQFASLPEKEQLTNIVYMGMGEPLDNADEVMHSLEILTAPWGYSWSPSRITLSTAGVAPALERFLLIWLI